MNEQAARLRHRAEMLRGIAATAPKGFRECFRREAKTALARAEELELKAKEGGGVDDCR